MPNPTISTAEVYSKDNKVTKLEALPIPNILADFHLNHQSEILLNMIRDLWETMGPAVVTGLNPTLLSGTWTISPGRILIDGYDVTTSESFEFNAYPSLQTEIALRVIESKLTFETDPSIIGFIPPGFSDQKTGANQYRYTASLIKKQPTDTEPALSGVQTRIKDYRILLIDSDGTTITEKAAVLQNGTVQQALRSLRIAIDSALAVRAEFTLRNVKKQVITTPFQEPLPVWQTYEQAELQYYEVGWGSENYGMQPYGLSRYVLTAPAIEDAIMADDKGDTNLYNNLNLMDTTGLNLTESIKARLQQEKVKGFGVEGNFGNEKYGIPGATNKPGDTYGWAKHPAGRAPFNEPQQMDYNDIYFGRRTTDDFKIVITANETDPLVNATMTVSANGVELPNIKLVGSI